MFSSNATQVSSANYIEEVFSTYLYTGNGSTQTITNGIDLSTKGGLVWIKDRVNANGHRLQDTDRGFAVANPMLDSSATGVYGRAFPSVNNSGFNLNFTDANSGSVNGNGTKYVSWTFRQQPKFFDIQTWTGNSTNRTISHALGSVPGCIIVKRTDTTSQWQVYHRSIANTDYLELNTTAGSALGANRWNSTTATSTVFSIGTAANVNATGGTYVAYIFAHNAGGFGLTGTDNVISCGSFTTNGSVQDINLGYEPQFIIYKRVDLDGYNWLMRDSMRGWPGGATATGQANLYPNLSNAEDTASDLGPIATGFQVGSGFGTGSTYIYIAIRRGPMKVPSTGTSVYNAYKPHSTGATISVGFPTDFLFTKQYDGVSGWGVGDRLRGNNAYLILNNTNAEASFANTWGFTQAQNTTYVNYNGANSISYFFRRAPSFFDEVCYTGTGSAQTLTHNLAKAPELMIVKSRLYGGEKWAVYAGDPNKVLYLNTTAGFAGASDTWDYTNPTSTQFSVGTNSLSGWTYVAYLFATCAGVSKVGSYTGTATTKQVDCGFTGGARFVLIKRTDSTGDWYVWDSSRGIVAGNDPYLLLNSTAAEVTSTDYVDTYSAGFEISSTAPAAINASGGTFIFLAIS